MNLVHLSKLLPTIGIACLLFFGPSTWAQEDGNLPGWLLAQGYTFNEYLEILSDYEAKLTCDMTDKNEHDCMRINVRKELARVTADLVIYAPELDNRVYIIEYSVDEEGTVGPIRTFNSDQEVQIDQFIERTLDINPIPRKKLVNSPETHQLATYAVTDYFQILDGAIRIPTHH